MKGQEVMNFINQCLVLQRDLLGFTDITVTELCSRHVMVSIHTSLIRHYGNDIRGRCLHKVNNFIARNPLLGNECTVEERNVVRCLLLLSAIVTLLLTIVCIITWLALIVGFGYDVSVMIS